MNICEMTATAMASALRRRELSAREVLRAHLDRIERLNPRINAIVTLTAEQATREAHEADQRSARGEPLGTLHGLPIAHKDTHLTAGIRTTFGSPVMREHVPDEDELVVARLRGAGAITIGKTNTPEFGAGSHTFNPIFGVTRNPYDAGRSAGGSSGGAAAALAAGMHPIADGSDMGGSLRNPASFCNVVGLRPSPGRVPAHPSRTPWSPLAVQGPMARTVEDVALMLSVMAGPHAKAPLALPQPGSAFATSLDGDTRGLRVGYSPDLGGSVPVESEVATVLGSAAERFRDLGCTVERACPDFTGADEVFRTMRAWQFEATLGGLLDEHRDRMKPGLVANIEDGRRLSGPDLGRAAVLQSELHQRAQRFFESYDVLLLPVSQLPPFDAALEYPQEVAGVPSRTYLDWMASCCHVSALGLPALSVPAGFTSDGLPIGVQIVGKPRADFEVLQVAHAFEQATGFGLRRPDEHASPPHETSRASKDRSDSEVSA